MTDLTYVEEHMIFDGHIKDIPGVVAETLRPCLKKPQPIDAVQIHKPFRVKVANGADIQGEAGDYLMCGFSGEMFIMNRARWEANYEYIDGDSVEDNSVS